MHRSSMFVACAAALSLLCATSARAQEAVDDRDQDLVDAYRVMQGVTMGLMGLTATGGLVQLYNLPTSFGDGACEENRSIFGEYACNRSFSLVHAALGIATLGSYTATGALALAAPDLDQGREDTVTDVLGVAHATGIGLTAALGLLAANPNLLGLSGNAASEFSRHMRVVHFVIALTTASLFASHMIVDYVD